MSAAAMINSAGGVEQPRRDKRSRIRRFAGTDNPRHLRVLLALLRRPMSREEVGREAGASNGPDLISTLRRRGLDLPCVRVEGIDRDGKPCFYGVYHLTRRDRRMVYRWFRERGVR